MSPDTSCEPGIRVNRRMGAGYNFTTDISEQLHIDNVKEADQSTNEVEYA